MKIKIHITKEVLYMTRFCNYTPIENEEFFSNPNTPRRFNDPILRSSANCAIAYAINKIFPYAIAASKQVILTAYYPSCVLEKDICTPLPYSATLFIGVFDGAKPSERVKLTPFSFEITIPDEYLKLVDISEVNKQLSLSETVEIVEK